MGKASGARFIKLSQRAAQGDRNAARQLILGGWWPETWDADNPEIIDRVIEISKGVSQ